MSSRVTFALLLIATVLLAGCGGGVLGLRDKKEPAAAPAVDLSRPNTPENRAVQVGWTSAGATVCGFNVPRDKLRTDYLNYEHSLGATPEALAKLGQTYDAAFQTLLAKSRSGPTYCTKKRIETIRGELQRHLQGDYTPSARTADEEES